MPLCCTTYAFFSSGQRKTILISVILQRQHLTQALLNLFIFLQFPRSCPISFLFSVVFSFFDPVPRKCFLFMCQRSDDSNLLVFLINLGIISSFHFSYNFLQTFGGFLHVTPAEFVQFILQNLRTSKSPRYGSSPKQSYDLVWSNNKSVVVVPDNIYDPF